MEESKFYRSTSGSPSSVMGGGLFMSPGRTQDCTLHGSALQRHHTTYATVGLSISLPASSTSELRYPTTAGAHSRYYRSSLGGRLGKGSMPGDMLPQPQRARSAYVGVFRHAPCTRGFKDMLWEPSFSAARPALTQMDLAKQMRFKARHVDQLELQQLPALLYREYKARKDNADGLDLSTSGDKEDDDLVEIDDVFMGGDPWLERLPRSEGDTPDGQADDKCCVICIETYTPWDHVRVLPKCKHVFHTRCIDMWLRGVCSYEACFTRSCPMCKTAIDFTPTHEQEDSSSLTQHLSRLSRAFHGRRNMRAPAPTSSALGSFDPRNNVASSSNSRSNDEPMAGLMSTLRDAIPEIPRWAYARAGDALLRGTSAPRAYSGSQTGSQGSAPPYVSAALQ